MTYYYLLKTVTHSAYAGYEIFLDLGQLQIQEIGPSLIQSHNHIGCIRLADPSLLPKLQCEDFY